VFLLSSLPGILANIIPGQENSLQNLFFFIIPSDVPNQPGPNTASTSFTLPSRLLDLVNSKAARELTNKSGIIRRALMNYLSPGERADVQLRIMENSGSGDQHNKIVTGQRRSVRFPKTKPRKKK
jgi:hypothetical protein